MNERISARAPKGTVHYIDALRQLGYGRPTGGVDSVREFLASKGLQLTHMLPYGKGYSYFVSQASLDRAVRNQPIAVDTPVPVQREDDFDARVTALEAHHAETSARIDRVADELRSIGAKLDALLKVWDAEVDDGK